MKGQISMNGPTKIPDSIMKIGHTAFSGCSGLKSVSISGKTTLENDVFAGCQKELVITYRN